MYFRTALAGGITQPSRAEASTAGDAWLNGGGGGQSGTGGAQNWEASLRKQNAANDELCTENGRLRGKIQCLRREVEALESREEAAVQEALAAVGGAGKAVSELTPAEETASLVHEKMALRELVEDQADKILALEAELQAAAGAGSPFLTSVLAGGAIGGALSVTAKGLSNLTDASGALSAGISALLLSRAGNPGSAGAGSQGEPVGLPAKLAVLGAEYEVVGRRGAVVRETDSLMSEFVADLPPGTMVRVVGLSEKNPRRVEVVARLPPPPPPPPPASPQPSPPEGSAAAPAAPDEQDQQPGPVAAAPTDGCSADVSLNQSSTEPPSPEPCDAGCASASPPPPPPLPGSASSAPAAVPEPPPPVGTEGGSSSAAAVGAGVATAAEGAPEIPERTPGTVVGWISAITKTGDLLIRPVSQKTDSEGEAASKQQPGDEKEEGSQEIESVTLSAVEWQLLHQDRELALQQVSDLTTKLNSIGAQLLQWFEMQTVFNELKLAAERAQDRRTQMREIAAMAVEDLVVWRERKRELVEKHDFLQDGQNGGRLSQHPGDSSALAKADEVGERVREMEDVDWNKLVTERETTAAALSAAFHRVAILRREADELEQERIAAEGRLRGEIGGLRQRLRQLAGHARRLPSRFTGSSSSSMHSHSTQGDFEAALSLFKNRISDLEQQIRTMRDQISQASTTEVALQRSLEARKAALRKMLCRRATWDLVVPDCGVTCGPFGGSLLAGMSIEAERNALRIAVEEQLRWNLQLTSGSSDGRTRQLQIMPTGVSETHSVGDEPPPAS